MKADLIVKYGSSTVTNETGVDRERMAHHADEIAGLQKAGFGVVLVSSGAIAVGRAMWQERRTEQTPDVRSLATIGSAGIMGAWQEMLGEHRVVAGQVLVTHREIDEPAEGSMLLELLRNNLNRGIVSVINENDALSDAEIAALSYGGDNDGLARHIAVATKATRLLLLTEVDGLLDDSGETVRSITPASDESVIALAGPSNGIGRGGMKSKLEAALAAARQGIVTHIASADASLTDVILSEAGTTVYPR
jgi:glutamate 5-kinase